MPAAAMLILKSSPQNSTTPIIEHMHRFNSILMKGLSIGYWYADTAHLWQELYANLRSFNTDNLKWSPTFACGAAIAPILPLGRITKTCLSPRGVCVSNYRRQSKYGDSHFKIAPLAICQEWAWPTALPTPNMLNCAGMRWLPLKREL